MIDKQLLGCVIILAGLCSCQQPTVINTSKPEVAAEVEGIFNNSPDEVSSNRAAAMGDRHEVLVLDTLQSARYTYLRVSENDKEFWLATLEGNYSINTAYSFDQGIYKTDYYSTEFNRNFDEIYLVSKLIPIHSNSVVKSATTPKAQSNIKQRHNLVDYEVEGSISIEELIKNAAALENQSVQITAKVTKVNANIMDRQWLHLQDGSRDDFDLVATSQAIVPVGHVVTLKATLKRKLDFGAGYSYDLILVNADLVNE
jgi:hypothetical protein